MITAINVQAAPDRLPTLLLADDYTEARGMERTA